MRFRLLFLLLFLVLPAAAQRQNPQRNWPSFRGPHASGVADGQGLPDTWDGEKGANIRWRTRIPGLAHSSPIVWEDKLFVTTAVSSRNDARFKPGLYGAGDASEDLSVHQWKVLCLDKKNGKILWEKTAYEGAPREKRHIKSTYASSTPATDGRYVVAFFGSQGLYAFDMKGKLVWKKDLGRLDVGAYDLPSYEWGTASSPIIYKDLVIVQCDTSKEDFLMALHLKTGEVAWKTPREELPSWATPTIYSAGGAGKTRVELITNAPNRIRGYDPETGRELWQLGGSSKITAPTPIFANDLIVVASGRRPEAPVFVIRGGANGDLTLPKEATTSAQIAWSRQKIGSYMPTPLIYQGLLYVLRNDGILGCYDLATGDEKYLQRIPHQGSGFSGSPVCADGRIYLPSEDGDIFIVKTGPTFELLGKNAIGQLLMATPALSDGMMFVRAEHDLFAIGRQ
ncbi:MAG: PQQ-binding-like beta-propeller repeat protein [Blastocatellia bacterium]|nr:PQQ-binding-like beta-propeller repeat protein [Blastocatellia bacterium]